LNNSAFDEYVNCPKLKVSVLLWGKTSKKILKWLKEHESDHHYRKVAKGIGLNSKKGYETVGRILRRLRKKGLVSTPMAPTIIYKEGSPCSGPLKPKRGYFQFPDSKAVLESVPNVPCFDVKGAKPCLMLHNLTWCWRGPPGVERWKTLLDRGILLPVASDTNIERYQGRSIDKALNHVVEFWPSGRGAYYGHCGAIPFFASANQYVDVLKTRAWFYGSDVDLEPVMLESFEAMAHFLAEAPDPEMKYLKIYYVERLGIMRVECFVKPEEGFKGPLTERHEKIVMRKQLEHLKYAYQYEGFLREKLDLPHVQRISHIGQFKGELRPKFRICESGG